MDESGIYFDNTFTNAMIAKGYDEGFLESGVPGESDYETEFLQEYLLANEYRNAALQELVLRENVYIPHVFDNFDPSPLAEYSGVEILQPTHDAHRSATAEDFEENGLILPTYRYFSSRGYDVTPHDIQNLIKADIFEMYHTLAEENMELIGKAGVLDLFGHIDENEKDELDRIIDARSEVDEILFELVTELGRVWNLYSRSCELEVPVLWDTNAQVERGFGDRLPQDRTVDRAVVGIYFDDLNTISVECVEDALMLRERSEINDFRNEVFGTISDIRKNDASKEDVERAVRNANQAINRLELVQKTGEVLTLAPVIVPAELVTSGVITTLGMGTVAASLFIKRKNDWAFVSRS